MCLARFWSCAPGLGVRGRGICFLVMGRGRGRGGGGGTGGRHGGVGEFVEGESDVGEGLL